MFQKLKKIPGLFLLAFVILSVRPAYSGNPIIIDSRHYSQVFGELRNFRIFLPPGYYNDPLKRYPVIYYYHGWSQRYFGSTSSTDRDEGESNNGDNIASFVATHDVIVVKEDGYNRKPHEEYYLRPYNISPVETYRQFPLYFPELVNYIDATYKTIPDRNHRAISGLSMGGFMTFWISGKYPHLVSAAGNFCGSPEFEIGPENFPVEYRHIDMARNYAGVNLRLNYGDMDFIRFYHRDMNRIWPQILDNYEYKMYHAEHTTCGLGEMFEFIMNTFKNPPAKPDRWDHIDVYPEFEVWDYKVSSDRDIAGFTILENVDKRGFRCSVREFLPDGELMPFVSLTVTTAPVYEGNGLYIIHDIDRTGQKTFRREIRADSCGRLRIELNGGTHEIGINKPADSPFLVIASVAITNGPRAVAGKETAIVIKLLNKGLSDASNVKATLAPMRNNARVLKNTSDFGKVNINSVQGGSNPFIFMVSPDTIEIERFRLTIKDGSDHEWIDYFDVPVSKNVPEIRNFEIADGRTFTVAAGGSDSTTLELGTGNGDGEANPGESIVILVREHNRYWRAELSVSDPYINKEGMNIRLSDNWGEYDHVGGSAKYSVPLIASGCPENHVIEFFPTYWLPNYPEHIIRQGKLTVKVTGKDQTPPVIRWATVSGDNTVQVKAFDGAAMKVNVRLIAENDAARTIEGILKDDGTEGDRCSGDRLFCKKWPEMGFGLFKMEIDITDTFGNTKTVKQDGSYVFH